MPQEKVKTGITQANDRRYNWIYYAVLWFAFTKLYVFAQDEWFSIDPKRENTVLNNLYYSVDGFGHVLIMYAGYKVGAWFSRSLIPLLIFFFLRFLLLVSFLITNVEHPRTDWNIDMPWYTSLFFVLFGFGCVVLTIKDLINRKRL